MKPWRASGVGGAGAGPAGPVPTGRLRVAVLLAKRFDRSNCSVRPQEGRRLGVRRLRKAKAFRQALPPRCGRGWNRDCTRLARHKSRGARTVAFRRQRKRRSLPCG